MRHECRTDPHGDAERQVADTRLFEQGLLAGDVGLEGIEGGLDLPVGGLERVQLGRVLGPFPPDPFPFAAGVAGRAAFRLAACAAVRGSCSTSSTTTSSSTAGTGLAGPTGGVVVARTVDRRVGLSTH